MRLRQVMFPWLSAFLLGITGLVSGQTNAPGLSVATNRPSLARARQVLGSVAPSAWKDFHARTGAGFALDLNLNPKDGGLVLLPEGESRSLVCGIQKEEAIHVLPLCRSRFELIPHDLLFAPEGEPGIRGEYYPGTALRGRLGAVQIDPSVDFNWGLAAPVKAVAATNFSSRWSGFIRLQRAGACQYIVVADGGVRLWVDGLLVIDDWTPGPVRQRTATANMKQTFRHAIRLDYFHTEGPAEVHLAWNWGLFTASPEVVSAGRSTLQSSEWNSPNGYSVRLVSPFAAGAVLDAGAFATQCQLAPAFAAIVTATNSGAEPKTLNLLCGFDQPALQIDGTNWTGIAYGAGGSNSNSALAISTASGPAVLREMNWLAAGKPHGLFVVPVEVPPRQSISRVFWITKFEDSLPGSSPSQRPYYTRCWPTRTALLDWLAAHGSEVLEAAVQFESQAVPPLNLPPDALLQWRGWNGSLGLSADAGVVAFKMPYSGSATNFYESRFTPEWAQKLRGNK